MSTRTVLVDDLDGTDAFRTIRFAFDGHTYEIDLSREHYDALKHGLAPWINAAREVSKYSNAPSSSGKRPARSRRESEKIRNWARVNGWPDVAPSGIIRREIVVAYQAAHQEPAAA